LIAEKTEEREKKKTKIVRKISLVEDPQLSSCTTISDDRSRIFFIFLKTRNNKSLELETSIHVIFISNTFSGTKQKPHSHAKQKYELLKKKQKTKIEPSQFASEGKSP
jgi:hypothetical protein